MEKKIYLSIMAAIATVVAAWLFALQSHGQETCFLCYSDSPVTVDDIFDVDSSGTDICMINL